MSILGLLQVINRAFTPANDALKVVINSDPEIPPDTNNIIGLLQIFNRVFVPANDALRVKIVGSSFVTGPGSASNENIVIFDGTTGNLIKDSGINISILNAKLSTTLGAFGSSPNSNGASVSGQKLSLQPADATNPGGVSTTTQTLAGAKTFSSVLSAVNIIDTGLTANTVPYANASKQLTSSAVTPTELGYVSGVTSAIQTQLTALDTRFKDGALTFIIDGGGFAITTGAKKAYLRAPYAGTITGWEIVADASGSIVLDVWKDTYANFPPTVADTITASAKPTLSAVQKNTSTTLTGWTTAVTKGDYIEINVDSATTVTKVILNLIMTR